MATIARPTVILRASSLSDQGSVTFRPAAGDSYEVHSIYTDSVPLKIRFDADVSDDGSLDAVTLGEIEIKNHKMAQGHKIEMDRDVELEVFNDSGGSANFVVYGIKITT